MNTPIISYFQDIGFNICQHIFPSKIKSPISPIQFQITFTKQKSKIYAPMAWGLLTGVTL